MRKGSRRPGRGWSDRRRTSRPGVDAFDPFGELDPIRKVHACTASQQYSRWRKTKDSYGGGFLAGARNWRPLAFSHGLVVPAVLIEVPFCIHAAALADATQDVVCSNLQLLQRALRVDHMVGGLFLFNTRHLGS